MTKGGKDVTKIGLRQMGAGRRTTGSTAYRMMVIGGLVFGYLVLTTARAQGDEAVIAGWNIAGVEAIPEERITKIAEVIGRIDPDLIVLSEVNPDSAAKQIVEELGADYKPPVILPQASTVVQNIAFVFKQHVTVTDPILIEGTDLAEENRSRKVLTAKVRIGEFDFVLLGVHLKSARGATERRQRTQQCRAMAAFIEEATSDAEKDVLVVGDYNMIPRMDDTRNDEENFFAMSPDNFLRFVSSDFLTGETSHISGCNPLRGNLLDGFAISRQFTHEYVGGSTRLLSFSGLGTSCRAFKRDVSDHRPMVSRFRIATDDD